jgi:hypothetical protein
MSYTYYLRVRTELAPSDFLGLISDMIGAHHTGDAVSIPGMLIGAFPADETDAASYMQSYGFSPDVTVFFRHQHGAEEDDAYNMMLGIIFKLLYTVQGDVVLESEDPITILIRVNGEISLNEKWSDVRRLMEFYPMAEVREMQSL